MFREENHGGLVVQRSDRIPYPHLFTTRLGGVSTGPLASLNLIHGHGDTPENLRENYRRVMALLGCGVDDGCVVRQVHGTSVFTATAGDRHTVGVPAAREADGLVTAVPGMPVFCFTADCVPVLLCDSRAGVVAAVHCGWRSSVGDILKNAVDAMTALGADVQRMSAAVGPAIGPCCFETDDDVPEAVAAWLAGDTDGLFRRRPDGKTMVDLKRANARRLQQLGLNPERVDVSDECTFCLPDKYWSHRYVQKNGIGERGGQCACIVIPEVKA